MVVVARARGPGRRALPRPVGVALTSATAFSPTDTMPLTLKAKLLVGVEEVVSLVLIVLVTARAVSVLGT